MAIRGIMAALHAGLVVVFGAGGDPTMTFTYSDAEGLSREDGVCRRDPSDVIRVDGTYYLWYTKVTLADELFPSGYNGTVWYATSTDEGHTWKERAMAVGRGEAGFDSLGVFTPNILTAEGKYYLYYTAVARGFTNKEYTEINKTAIAVATANSPEGPWTKPADNIVIRPSEDTAKFDSFRVDDSCLIVRGGKYWLYYKGRQWEHTPRETKMGVAIADHPLGPFIKQNGGSHIQDSGHEVMVWPFEGGVLSLVSEHGPNGRTLQFAQDGLDFRVVQRGLENQPNAPGAFRRDLSGEPAYDNGIRWGISMVYKGPPHLLRYEIVEGE